MPTDVPFSNRINRILLNSPARSDGVGLTDLKIEKLISLALVQCKDTFLSSICLVLLDLWFGQRIARPNFAI